MADITDEAIALQAQQGDTHAFGVLVERYEQKMERYARKFLFGGEDVADVVQELFLKAYVNIRSFDASRRFSPWLYRIAHNEFVTAGKKRKKEPISFFDFDTFFPHLTAPETPLDDMHRADTRRLVEECLEKLSPKYREVLVLFYIEEMEYKDIADILQIPTATVGIRLRRGKAAMQKIIMDNDAHYGQ